MALIILAIVVLSYAVMIEPYMLKVTVYKLANKQLSGVRIVFATDFHIAPYVWERKRLRNIIEAVNEQNADLVILGGDYVNRHSKISTLEPEEIAANLQQIRAVKAAVLGNHDSYYGKNEVRTALENVGIIVLDNDNMVFDVMGRNITIAGVSDYYTDTPDVEKALANTKNPIIFVTHSPDVFQQLADKNPDVALAGHTHGGQVVLPLIGPLLVPSDYGRKYAYGLQYERGIPLITSSGLGTSLLPIRFNNVPEIVVLEFE